MRYCVICGEADTEHPADPEAAFCWTRLSRQYIRWLLVKVLAWKDSRREG